MLLEKVNSPQDIKPFSVEELKTLCAEIRDYMIRCCAVNPGHLGSSLGAVELITGIHYVYDTPRDKVVFDVGHQAYAHKILTGRKEAFKANRTREGISGFPKRTESPYDAFGAGHSSTSVSAALGLADAARLQGTGEKVVALIGDGALTGGLAWEGLNNAGASGADILVILNDNNISIDRNTGGIHDYLLHITTDSNYNRLKRKVWNFLGDRPLRRRIQKMVVDAKSNLVRHSGGALFEALGFRYFGPIDGNDIEQVTTTLARLRRIPGPRILHCITRKGKGYPAAEADPIVWHAPGRFNPETGEREHSVYKADRYQDVFGKVLVELARMDPKVVGVTPAMATGCGMNILEKEIPERFFDVGIEEEHAVTFSAGLAAGGLKPFCNIYSSFCQRAYDQIIHDVALQGLPLTLCLDRAGLVGEDGPTHHGVFDLAAYRSIPGVTLAAPRNELELKNLMYSSLQNTSGPYIIRYPRGCGEGVAWKEEAFTYLEPGRGEKLLDGEGLAILAAGPVANRAVEAALRWKEAHGSCPAVYDLRFVKPLDRGILEEASRFGAILTLEEGSLKGGVFGAVAEYLAETGRHCVLKGHGIPDHFIVQDTQAAERASCGLDSGSIFEAIGDLLKNC